MIVIEQFTWFHDISFEATRDTCAVQAQAARLRLLDYGVAHGVAITGTGFGVLGTVTYSLTEALTPTPEAPGEEVAVEQDVELLYGQMRWTVKAWRDWGDEYNPEENGGYTFTSENRLIAVYFAVENTDASPLDVRFGPGDAYDILLSDAEGRTYAVIDRPYIGRCRPLEVNPGLRKSCILVYEVPPDTDDFSIVFREDDGDNEQTVTLKK